MFSNFPCPENRNPSSPSVLGSNSNKQEMELKDGEIVNVLLVVVSRHVGLRLYP